MLIGHFRVILRHLLDDLSPESRGIQHVCLIYTRHLFAPLHGNVKTALSDPSDLVLIVGQRIRRCQHAVHFLGLARSEIQSAGQFPHNHHVKSVPDDVVPKRACGF